MPYFNEEDSKQSTRRTSVNDNSAIVESIGGYPFAETKVRGVADAAEESRIAANNVVVKEGIIGPDADR